MRKALLTVCAVFLLASFANDTSNKTILKDINGTLLESYAVIDNNANTVTFSVDANTSVSSSVIDGEFRIFLVENGSSGTSKEYTLAFEEVKELSFDHYFEASYEVASGEDFLIAISLVSRRPKKVIL